MAADLTLARRVLGRTQKPVSPLLWQVGDAPDATIDPDLLAYSARAGADWLFIPHDATEHCLVALRQTLARVNATFSLVIGLSSDALQSRAATPLQQRLSALGVANCAAVMLQDISAADVKSGRPFHRLIQLRDRGLVQTFWIESQTSADAEWMIENTPAHAMSLPFGLLDQTARYRITAAAIELGTAIVASPVIAPAWRPSETIKAETDIAFAAGEDAIASILRPLPGTLADLRAMFGAAAHPMPQPEREHWWNRFQQAVAPPPRPRRGEGPEFGA